MSHDDLAAFVPMRFVDAFKAEEFDQLTWAIGCYVAALSYQSKNTSEWAVVRLADLAVLFGMSHDTIGRRLHDLEEHGWVQLDVVRGRSAWRVRVTALHSPARPPQELRGANAPEGSPVRNSTYAGSQSRDDGKPHPETVSRLSEPPQNDSARKDTRPDPTRPSTCLEETVEEDRGALRGKRLAELERIGKGEPAGEAAFLAEVNALIGEGVLVESEDVA